MVNGYISVVRHKRGSDARRAVVAMVAACVSVRIGASGDLSCLFLSLILLLHCPALSS